MKVSNLCFPIRNGKVYLSEKKRGLGQGYLNGYGGKVNDGETVEVAAAREILEESGVVVSPEALQKVGVIDFYEEGEQIFECHIYTFAEWEGEFEESEEKMKPEVYDLESVPLERMFPADRKWVPLIFKGEKIRAKCYYNKGLTEEIEFEYQSL